MPEQPGFTAQQKDPRQLGSDLVQALAQLLAHNSRFLDDLHQARPLVFRGTVTALQTTSGVRQVQVRRTGQAQADGYWYPIYDGGYSATVGDDVLLLYTDGRLSACVIGARTKTVDIYGPSSTVAIVSDATARALSLWNGSANNSPPANWQTSGFDDSAWAPAVVIGPMALGGATAANLWPESIPLAATEQALVRQAFPLPAGTITAATLSVWANDDLNGSWINGQAVAGTSEHSGAAGPTLTATLSPSWLQAGGTNVLATWGINVSGASGIGDAKVAYALVVSYAGAGQLLAVGSPQEGDLAVFTGGAWARLPIGTTGQELTVVGGDPAWATPPAGGSVASVALAGPTGTTVSGSPVTASGTLTLSWASQGQNAVLAGPASGSGAPTFRALVAGDIPGLPASQITTGQLATARGGTGLDASGVTDGQLPIGRSSDHSLGLAALTAGSGITITNSGHSITIDAAGGGGIASSTSVLLDWAASADNSPGLVANTWVDLCANQSFSVALATSVVEIAVSGCTLLTYGGGSWQYGTRIVIDSAGSALTKMIAGGWGASGSYQNAYNGANLVAVTGLSAGSHTVKIQVQQNQSGSTLANYASSPAQFAQAIRVLERK